MNSSAPPCAKQLSAPWFTQSSEVHGRTNTALGEYSGISGSLDAL
ncbi:MAG: hypothetical protein AB8A30_04225 [Prochlorococcus sp.]